MSDTVPSQIWQRVVQIRSERTGRPGTGFIVEVDGSRYLLTAKHLCDDAASDDLTIRYPWSNGGRPFTAELTRVGSALEGGDAAAFALHGTVLERVNLPGVVPLNAADMVFTQECLILGYPHGLTFDLTWGGVDTFFPVAKRGTIAGATQAERFGDGEWWLLDVVANPGFSGGPVAAHIGAGGDWKFVGVVAGAISGPLEEGSVVAYPSGLSYATQAGQAGRLVGIPKR
ncbi:S1 family peptidase [Cellulomonas sp. URHB0016]